MRDLRRSEGARRCCYPALSLGSCVADFSGEDEAGSGWRSSAAHSRKVVSIWGPLVSGTRSKNLTDADIGDVVDILDGWSGKLSWDLLIDAIERRRQQRYTRQALHRHVRIRDAFQRRKQNVAGQSAGSRAPDSPELRAALERIARLDAENKRLRMENDRLLEQFAVWAYNAHTRGLDRTLLNRALPAVDRARTPGGTAKRKRGADLA